MNRDARIFVAGHRGLVGSAIIRELDRLGFSNQILRARQDLDLADATAVADFFHEERPEYVFDAAARVGGILANDTYPADFLLENLKIQNNLIEASWRFGVSKFLFLGSSCIYPKHAPQPVKEEYLLTGPLELTNQWYAIAKIAGIKLCQALRKQHGFSAISLMPTNLYGPGDSFSPQGSHVLPALIRKFHDARESGSPFVEIWGTGTPRREFLHVDDMAHAAIFLMQCYDGAEIVNVGVGKDISIRDLAELVGRVVGYEGELRFDSSKPDGTPRKLLDVSRLDSLGWQPRISLEDGIRSTYRWFEEHLDELRD
jgi:GDP-L-fucose synthase